MFQVNEDIFHACNTLLHNVERAWLLAYYFSLCCYCCCCCYPIPLCLHRSVVGYPTISFIQLVRHYLPVIYISRDRVCMDKHIRHKCECLIVFVCLAFFYFFYSLWRRVESVDTATSEKTSSAWPVGCTTAPSQCSLSRRNILGRSSISVVWRHSYSIVGHEEAAARYSWCKRFEVSAARSATARVNNNKQ